MRLQNLTEKDVIFPCLPGEAWPWQGTEAGTYPNYPNLWN